MEPVYSGSEPYIHVHQTISPISLEFHVPQTPVHARCELPDERSAVEEDVLRAVRRDDGKIFFHDLCVHAASKHLLNPVIEPLEGKDCLLASLSVNHEGDSDSPTRSPVTL